MLLKKKVSLQNQSVCFQLYNFQKKAKLGDSKKISDYQGGRGSRMSWWSRGFLGKWSYSVWYYKDGYMSSCICQTIECTAPKMNLMWAVGSGWRWFTRVYSSVVADVPLRTVGTWCVYWGMEEYGNSPYFLLSFAINLKLY